MGSNLTIIIIIRRTRRRGRRTRRRRRAIETPADGLEVPRNDHPALVRFTLYALFGGLGRSEDVVVEFLSWCGGVRDVVML